MNEKETANRQMEKLAAYVRDHADSQYTLCFRGRSMPATVGEIYESVDAEGFAYTSISFWDGDSGNLFDVDYRRVPEKIFADGTELTGIL